MNTSNKEVVKQPATWKRLASISLFAGAGFATVAALILSGILWYSSRPKPPETWNATALEASEPPGFGPSNDGKKIALTYIVQNNTDLDYQLESNAGLKFLVKRTDGSLSQPFSSDDEQLVVPIFIPQKQKGTIEVQLTSSKMPKQSSSETDEQFHERLR